MDITISNVNKQFGENRVLNNFSAIFPSGSRTCVMGRSGCGKTTLMNLLLGLQKPDAGQIDGMPKKVAAVFQEDRLCEDFSAVSNVRMVTGRRVAPERIRACLHALGLPEESAGQPVRELSGGMRRRVAIARALLSDFEVLLLDEPFKGLDNATRDTVIQTLCDRVGDRTVICVTHDRADAARLSAGILEMGRNSDA